MTAITLPLFVAAAAASLWVDQSPDYVRPYAIERYANAQALTIGSQVYRFPVTGAASNNKFTLLTTNAPHSGELGVLPHIHEKHHENFYCLKGRHYLWSSKDNDTQGRLMTAGDFGSVPVSTTHTFQLLDPDTEMVGVIAPGSFEDLFFYLANKNVTYESQTPYSPSNVSDSAGAGSSPDIITKLESFDVYAQLNFTPPRNFVNGSLPTDSGWHTAANSIPDEPGSPYFVAANWGPKYLNGETGSWQIVQPFVTPSTGEHKFTQGTITLSRQFSNISSPTWNLEDHTAIQVVEGAVLLTIGGENVTLLGGDVGFVPGGVDFSYVSKAAFSKFMYVSSGAAGLDQQLLKAAKSWAYPVFPTNFAF